MRVPLLAACLLVALAGTGARATTCPLVTDPAHDEHAGALLPVVPTGVPDAPALDIVSADLGFVGDDVVGVVRVRDLGGGAGPFGTGEWVVNFETPFDLVFELWAAAYADGSTDFWVYRVDEQTGQRASIGTATGTIGTAGDEVRVVAPRSAFAPWLLDGRPLAVQASTYGGASTADPPQDVPVVVRMDVTQPRPFEVGSPGCLA